MKQIRIILGTALTMAGLLIAPVAVYAQNTTSASPPATEVETMAQRIEKLKTSLNIKLTDAQTASLKQKCTAAQAKGKTLLETLDKTNATRTEVYGEIGKTLTDIIGRLKAAKYDTAKLESEGLELQTLAAAYSTSFNAYSTAVSDLSEVDCVADPTGFKVSLESARTSRAMLAKDTAAIKTYANDTVRKSLKEASTSLSGNN